MGVQCLICHCRYQKGCGISFHSFPKDDKYKLLWLQACRKSEVQSSPRVCSNHFTTDSFESHKDYAKKTLKKSAIPTLCLLKRKKQPDNLIIAEKINEQPETVPISVEIVSEPCDNVLDKSEETSSVLVKAEDDYKSYEENMEDCATGTGPSTPVSHKRRKIWRPSKVGECSDFSTPRRAKHCFEIAVSKINEQRKKLRACQARNRRFCKKISSLKDLVKDLRKKNLISQGTERTLLVNICRCLSSMNGRFFGSSPNTVP